MNSVTLQHQWADASVTSIVVEVESDYPDALAEARATAVRGLMDAIGALSAEEDD